MEDRLPWPRFMPSGEFRSAGFLAILVVPSSRKFQDFKLKNAEQSWTEQVSAVGERPSCWSFRAFRRWKPPHRLKLNPTQAADLPEQVPQNRGLIDPLLRDEEAIRSRSPNVAGKEAEAPAGSVRSASGRSAVGGRFFFSLRRSIHVSSAAFLQGPAVPPTIAWEVSVARP